jgi:hypothetical protein
VPDLIAVEVSGFKCQASKAVLAVWDAYVKLSPNERGLFRTIALNARLEGAPVADVYEEVQEAKS